MEHSIESITIRNYKGIKEKTLSFECCLPNKITIVVGRNGVGKSSFAKFLSCLNSSKVKIDESDYYANNKNSQPNIELCGKYDGKDIFLLSDLTQNQIAQKYHFEVINSPIYAKDSSRVINGTRFSSVKLATHDIEIIDVKKKVENPYEFKSITTDIKQSFPNARGFKNLKELFLNTEFLSSFVNDFFELKSKKRLMSLVDQFLNSMETTNNSKDSINSIQHNTYYEKLIENDSFKLFQSFVSNFLNNNSSNEIILNTIQLLKWNVNKKIISDYRDYLINKDLVDSIKNRITSVNTTNRKVLFVEGDKLILRLPDVRSISNGERDLLVLTARLLRVLKRPYKTKHTILILDEIFDYLDGSNLLELQYLLSELLNDCKKFGYKYYVLLFTHIDPVYFNSFVLNKSVKVNYFEQAVLAHDNKIIEDMIINRENLINKDLISQKYVHYYPTCSNSYDDSEMETERSFFQKYCNNYLFYKELYKNTLLYLNDKKYDIICLCLSIRIQSEVILYNMIPEEHRKEFLDLHGPKKIEFAEKFLDIPTFVSLLRIVFNESAHLNEYNIDLKKKMLYLRMNTLPIKKMVKELFDFSLGKSFLSLIE